jgi:hypothetical protein
MSIKLKIKIALFLILMLFAPSIYFIFVAAGFMPPILYLFYIAGSKELFITLMWLVHLSIYGVIYFAISYAIIEFIYKSCSPNKRQVVISSLLLLLISISLLPIYVIGGHNSASTTNIFGVYKSAGAISYLPW